MKLIASYKAPIFARSKKRKMIKKIVLAIISCFSTCLLLGQLAPDFTITDTQGEVHQLYADHLNQGQTVLIKVFFTSCPPCANAAPHIQDLYVQWGEGQYDVEFFELSNKTWDSNANVLAFQNTYNQTYPGAGEDGGSVTAVSPFIDGTFGQFFGTPTYIVIAPDGSVDFDVRGSGLSGTLEAINESIEATGAIGMESAEFASYQINISDIHSNNINPPLTNIYLRSNSNPSIEYNITSLSGGTNSFEYPSTEIPEISNPVLEIECDQSPGDGLSALDLLLYQKHILNISTISNQSILSAGDVNGSNSVSATDLGIIAKVIKEINSEFPSKAAWEFYFQNCGNCQTLSLPYSPGGDFLIEALGTRTGDASY